MYDINLIIVLLGVSFFWVYRYISVAVYRISIYILLFITHKNKNKEPKNREYEI